MGRDGAADLEELSRLAEMVVGSWKEINEDL